jgi:hypothetical protein
MLRAAVAFRNSPHAAPTTDWRIHIDGPQIEGEVAMSRFQLRGRKISTLVATLLIGSLGTVSTAWAQADDDPFGAEPAAQPAQRNGLDRSHLKRADDERAHQRIRDALGTATTMEFVETPLQDAVDYLKDFHGIEIQLDGRSLEEAGMGSDTPVTGALKGLSLESALDLLLSNYDLTYVVRNGVLQITTPEAVASITELRVYDVHDLLQEGDVGELSKILALALDPPQPPKAPKLGGAVPTVAHVTTYPTADASQNRAANDTASVILPYGNLVVVRASILEHEAIEDLLKEMRTAMVQGKN